MKDPYGLLDVARTATDDDIRKAYRRQARKHHPDANPDDPHAEERFKEIQQAYETLSNPKRRRAYDEGLAPLHKDAPHHPVWLPVGLEGGPPGRWISPACSGSLVTYPAGRGRSAGNSGWRIPRM
jgi:curved DNA-binding protein CbpA